jgi:hypothetical protein
VELVPVGTYNGGMGITLVDQTTAHTSSTPGNDFYCNNGNWNALWGGCTQSGKKQVTFAFRRWDKYDAVGNYDFSTANVVRRTTADGTTVGFGHGGLYKKLLQTSPYNPNDKRTHSPFVVIEPGSQILCIRLSAAKSYSTGDGEGDSGAVGGVTFVSGNDTFFGSTTNINYSFSANTNDVPSAFDAPIGLAINAASNAVVIGYGIISAKGTKGKFGVNTSSSYGSLNNGTWMNSKNYSTTSLTSTLYGFSGTTTNTANIVSPGILPALTVANTSTVGSGHVGWKYVCIDADDGAGAAGTTYHNYNMGTDFSGNRSLGSTLFLVIPP